MHPRVQQIAANARAAGFFLDFDGTLAPIVERPADALPHPEATQILERLGDRFKVLAIVSGRSATELITWLGPEREIWGSHGAERVDGGRISVASEVLPYVGAMQEARAIAAQRVVELELDGVIVEDKSVMIALHHRAAADGPRAAAALDRLSAELAERFGLSRSRGRMVFELRPPVALSKGSIVGRRIAEADLEGAMFLGDDLVDIPAFEALDAAADRGVVTVKVAVASSEAPAELLDRADVVVDGVAGAISFLRSLLDG